MRSFTPRPVLLVLTLLLIVGAISFIQFRFQPADASNQQTQSPPTQETKEKPTVEQSDSQATDTPLTTKPRTASKETSGQGEDKESAGQKQTASEATSGQQSIASKEAKYPRAKEIVDPTGFINTDGVSIKEAAGEKVVLLQFWTYSCYNCQNAQPYINSFHEEYADEGLQVIGIHKPEFEFEKDYASVAEAVRQENIQYPVVLDNNDATWNAYDQNYWPTWYLIDADGFVRYKHIGEGAYDETEKKIQELLAERDRA